MRMHSRPSTHKAPARAGSGSLFTAALPFLLAASGMILVGVALIIEVGILVLAGAGIVVIAASMYFIAAGLDRADRDRGSIQRTGSRKSAATDDDLPRRGPLADAAVDALTRTDGPGGVWPPLSDRKDRSTSTPTSSATSAPIPTSTASGTPRAPTASTREEVPMWDPHGRVAPQSFQDTSDSHKTARRQENRPAARPRASAQADHQEALMEFQSADTPNPHEPTSPSSHPSSGSPQPEWDQEPSRATDRDLRVWPGANDLGSWGHLSRASEQERMSEKRRAASMKERRDRFAQRLPTVGAILASPEKDEAPPKSGATRGKCSSCQSYLWAPPQRPITLKCPSCGHKARLY